MRNLYDAGPSKTIAVRDGSCSVGEERECICGESEEAVKRELCRWMRLAHALVEKPTSVRPIIVGTHEDGCGDIVAVLRRCGGFFMRAEERSRGHTTVYDTRMGAG